MSTREKREDGGGKKGGRNRSWGDGVGKGSRGREGREGRREGAGGRRTEKS